MEQARALRTDEDVYLFVRGHLLAQARRSETSTGWCRYRGACWPRPGDLGRPPRPQHALACAIGCLIPDGLYDPLLENRPVTAFYADRDGLGYGAPDDDAAARASDALFRGLPDLFTPGREALLVDLQQVHDHEDPARWPDLLAERLDRFRRGRPGVR